MIKRLIYSAVQHMFLIQAYLGIIQFLVEEGRVIDSKKSVLLAELD